MRRLRWLLVLIVLAACAVYLFPRPLLAPLGRYLVDAGPPVKSDCLFVLAGDMSGQRIIKAAELYKAGFAPKLLVSGPAGIFGHSEDELAIAFARQQGMNDIPYIGIPHGARSTETEGEQVFTRLREASCASVLVVTSDFHTRRAARLLRRAWPGIDVRMVAAPAFEYNAEAWWTDRNYQKTFLLEWTKTVTSWFGI